MGFIARFDRCRGWGGEVGVAVFGYLGGKGFGQAKRDAVKCFY